ncbi:MAG: hypothetical protein ACRDRH_04520 [Pseudonocardia sp.]
MRLAVALGVAGRRAGRYAKLGAALPALLEELTLARHTAASPREREQVFGLLVAAFYAAHGLAYRLGYADLAESVEHKLGWTAEHTGDPLAVGLAQWTRINSFQAAGEYDRGLRLLDTARQQLDEHLDLTDPAAVTVYGSMHLRASTLASRTGDANITRDHLNAATELSERVRRDQVHYQLTFGPANTAIHDAAAAVELGDAERAVHVGAELRPSRGLPPTRIGHHFIDLARAHLMLGDRPGTLATLATEIERLDQDPGSPPLLPAYGGRSPHKRSHGESFLDLVIHRFGPGGLYLLDEPEAALSVRGCLALLTRMSDLVADGCQLLVATHSPILLAMPGATILEIADDGEIERVDYDQHCRYG